MNREEQITMLEELVRRREALAVKLEAIDRVLEEAKRLVEAPDGLAPSEAGPSTVEGWRAWYDGLGPLQLQVIAVLTTYGEAGMSAGDISDRLQRYSKPQRAAVFTALTRMTNKRRVRRPDGGNRFFMLPEALIALSDYLPVKEAIDELP